MNMIMKEQNFIGIDPASGDFEIALFKDRQKSKLAQCEFDISAKGLAEFKDVIQKHQPVIIAIEGKNGLCSPIEKMLRKEGIVFYSLKASAVSNYRKAMLGQNKNNKIDAESTALFAMALYDNERLERFKAVHSPDEALRMITRTHSKIAEDKTAEVNHLWKLIHTVSPDFYRYLQERSETKEALQLSSLLHLLLNQPDLSTWKDLSEEEMIGLMEAAHSAHIINIIHELKEVTALLPEPDTTLQKLIQMSARHIIDLKHDMKELESLLKDRTDDKVIKKLTELKGIGITTAAKIEAEIGDIRRFKSDDNLASYSGLCGKEHSTGNNKNEIKSSQYCRRLKDLSMGATRSYITHNPNDHLTGYYKNLISKRGMKKTEALKRAARAFIRTLYKLCWEVIEETEEEKRGKRREPIKKLEKEMVMS